MPGGMVPPAGRIGNPRQFNPGQGPMQPGQPNNPGDIFGGIGREVGGRLGRAIVRGLPGGGGGSGSGKGGMPGPGGPSIGMPVERPPMFIDGNGNPTRDHGGGAINMNINPFNPAYRDGGGEPPMGQTAPDNNGGDGGGGFGGLNARADGRDPFEFGEDPEFEEQRQRNYRQYPQPGNPTPAPVQRNPPMNQYTRTRAPRIR